MEYPIAMMSFIVGVFFVVIIDATSPYSYAHQGRKAIDTCEAHLPRDQHCVITAHPSGDGKGE